MNFSLKIFLLLFLFSFFDCSKNEKRKVDKNELIQPIEYIEYKKSDTINEPNYIAIFDDKTETKTTLSKNEPKIVNANLINAVNKYNDDLKIKLDKWNKEDKSYKRDFEKEKLNLRYFYRQYFVSTNEKGEKIVSVFCFCSYFGNWKDERIRVLDGGDCYLNAIINISKNKTEYFRTHGQA